MIDGRYMNFYDGYDENDKGGYLVDDEFNETDITLFDMMMSSYKYETHFNPKTQDDRQNILDMPHDIRAEIVPEFDYDDESTWPPRMRWHNYLNEYSQEYIDSLEAPLIFRSAMQCKGLSTNRREFQWEYEKMAVIAPYAVKLFLDYCEIVGVKWDY